MDLLRMSGISKKAPQAAQSGIVAPIAVSAAKDITGPLSTTFTITQFITVTLNAGQTGRFRALGILSSKWEETKPSQYGANTQCWITVRVGMPRKCDPIFVVNVRSPAFRRNVSVIGQCS